MIQYDHYIVLMGAKKYRRVSKVSKETLKNPSMHLNLANAENFNLKVGAPGTHLPG